MAGKKDGQKLYLIGIDAASGWIIRDFSKKYKLDGFAKFMDDGAFTDMESVLPPMTGPAWPSIYTGVRPSEHGVPEFLKMEPNYTKTVVFYDPTMKEPFWDKLAHDGLRSLVMTPAMLVRPSKERNVDMMTGFPLPARFSSKEMEQVARRHKYMGEPDMEVDMKSGKITLRQASDRYIEAIETRSKISKELITKNGYDLSFICFTETDRMQHFSLNQPKWDSYVLPLYEKISEFMLWVDERAKREGATVIVISDHGAQPIRRKFLMNGWLLNNGYSKVKGSIESGLKNPSRGSVKYELRESLLKSGLRKKVYDKLPNFGKKLVKTTIASTLSGTSSEDYTRLHDFDYDMSKTYAFASIANCMVTTIYVNDERFENGIVSATEKPKLKKRLMADLLKIKDEDGNQLMVNAWDADDYYEGTGLFIAPDVMAEARKGYLLDAFGYLKSGGLFMDPEMAKRGDHLRDGILGVMSYGKKLDYGAIAKKKHYVYNVEPTVMGYFGLDPENDKRYKPIF
jgi:predicted AlkP superfamily phosphohydrolase/phosphomutase